MGKVFISVGVSLDGYMAGPNGGPANPIGDGGTLLHEWMFQQNAFLKSLGMEGGKTEGVDNQMVAQVFERAGAYIIGKRMFEEGENNWPEDSPFHAPVFVLTHEKRKPWPRAGSTTFYFVNGSIQNALAEAKKVAGSKDVRIGGGADVIRQYLNAGLVDDLTIHLVPQLLGKGKRLFEQIDTGSIRLEIKEAIHSPDVTHLSYLVKKGG